jgi:predicted metal-dependent hydrolase
VRVQHNEAQKELCISVNQSPPFTEQKEKMIWNGIRDYYAKKGHEVIPDRVKYYAQLMKLFPKKITLRAQKTRWGSCTSEGHISLNWRLMGAPLAVLDYVVIQELAHLKHPNHSKAFWSLVEAHCPGFRIQEAWLKNHQSKLRFLLSVEIDKP